MTRFENWGDYFWPGQIDECRINKLDIRDAKLLEQHERVLSAGRAAEIASGAAPIARTNDLDHLRAIHRHLFQDVYEWAGELRVTELVRPSEDPHSPPHEFVKPEDVPRLAEVVFAQLGDPARLRDRPTSEIVDVSARTYAGVNVLHPFVEGNGRTQRIFLSQVAEQAGYRIHWQRIASRQNEVMAEAFDAGPNPVREALAQCLERLPDSPAHRDAIDAARHAQAGLASPAGAATDRPSPGQIHHQRQSPHGVRDRELDS